MILTGSLAKKNSVELIELSSKITINKVSSKKTHANLNGSNKLCLKWASLVKMKEKSVDINSISGKSSIFIL
jgi:hypothetical protein